MYIGALGDIHGEFDTVQSIMQRHPDEYRQNYATIAYPEGWAEISTMGISQPW